jgi:hypothetical protein
MKNIRCANILTQLELGEIYWSWLALPIANLQENDMFKMKITLDRQSPRPKPNHCHLPDPLHFSLLSTFEK